MGIIALATLVTAGAGVILLSRAMPNFQPGDRKVQEDLKELRKEVAALYDDLVPLNAEEIETFSLDPVKVQVRKNITFRISGIFTTIYEEQLLAFSYKKYISSGKSKNAILFIQSARHEFAYRIKSKGIQVVIDGQLVGTFKSDDILYAAKSKNKLVELKRDRSNLIPVQVHGNELGSMKRTMPQITKKKGKAISQRAFEFVQAEMKREELLLFIAVAAYDLIDRLVE